MRVRHAPLGAPARPGRACCGTRQAARLHVASQLAASRALRGSSTAARCPTPPPPSIPPAQRSFVFRVCMNPPGKPRWGPPAAHGNCPQHDFTVPSGAPLRRRHAMARAGAGGRSTRACDRARLAPRRRLPRRRSARRACARVPGRSHTALRCLPTRRQQRYRRRRAATSTRARGAPRSPWSTASGALSGAARPRAFRDSRAS